jgi:predicted methyltransferase
MKATALLTCAALIPFATLPALAAPDVVDPPHTTIFTERPAAMETGARLDEIINATHRSESSILRNEYRNPRTTLLFIGVRPDMTVVEVWPGTGWYTEILAPLLREQGRLVAAQFPADSEIEYQARTANAFAAKLEAEPSVYDRVHVVSFAPPDHATLGEPDSADMVLLSRVFHSFLAGGIVDDVLAAAHEVLRPGGILAIIQHRAANDASPYSEREDGYVSEAEVVEHVTAAGFELDARSEINANPSDPRDHPAGVWTLPPTLAHCRDMGIEEQLACETQYRAIGESDRMTLRFILPE